MSRVEETRRPSSVAVSEERFATVASRQGDLELCFQTFGDPADPALLLVMGLGGPMTWWDPALCTLLAERGFHVIRYDNRDTGRSSRVRGRVTRADLARSFVGRAAPPPYHLTDLADDGIALLDHLGHEAAHLVGVSMGGMIAQTAAVHRPDRVRSLTSIMSTTGRRTVGWQDPRLLPMLVARRGSREQYIDTSARLWRLIGSPMYPDTANAVRERAAETWDRGITPAGVARQMSAILAQPDRTRELRTLDLPTLVVHGTSDRMVHVSGGRATAHAIRGSELLLVPGMGHDLPRELYGALVDAITRTAARA